MTDEHHDETASIVVTEEACVGRHAAVVSRWSWRTWAAIAGVVTVGGVALAAPRPGGTSAPATTAPATTAPATAAPATTAQATTPASDPPTTAVGTSTATTLAPTTVLPTSTTTATTMTTTAPAATVAPTVAATVAPPTGVLVLDLLVFVAVTNEHRGGYDRDLFEHWISQGGGCSTRDVVLGRDSSTPVQRDPFGCDVVAGDWFSVYDGAQLTDPSDVDIDHVVALKEAWDSGAWAWTAAERRAFANDLGDRRSLRAVDDGANADKGDRDPSNWLPPRQEHWCTYLGDWVAVKVRWGLSMDQSEYGRIRNLMRDRCPDWRVEPVDVVRLPVSAAAEIQPLVPVLPQPLVSIPAAGGGDVYYANCAAARAVGADPIYVGQPGYRPGLDRDGDGVACE